MRGLRPSYFFTCSSNCRGQIVVMLKSINTLEKYLNEQSPQWLTGRHLTRNEIGDDLAEALQRDCETDFDLVLQCADAKGWEVFEVPVGTVPAYTYIKAGPVAITIYTEKHWLFDETVPKSKWLWLVGAIKHLLTGK